MDKIICQLCNKEMEFDIGCPSSKFCPTCRVKGNKLVEMSIPKRWWKDYDLRKDVEEAYANGDGVFLTGAVGNGKTTQAIELLKRQRAGIYWSIPNLLYTIRSSYQQQKSEEKEMAAQIIDDCVDIEHLVLDDLGVEKQTDWVSETIYLIINNRYAENKKIILTSNLDLKEIAEKIGDRIASRLVAMTTKIDLGSIDYRLKKE